MVPPPLLPPLCAPYPYPRPSPPQEALDELGLPLNVQRGMVDRLVVDIPWMHLSSRPLVISIDSMYLSATENTFPAAFGLPPPYPWATRCAPLPFG